MSWFPANNMFDGLNSTPVNDVEVNSPYYVWTLEYNLLRPVQLVPPLLTTDPGSGEDSSAGEDGERLHYMRTMVVPAEKGRRC